MSRNRAKTTLLNWYDKAKPSQTERLLFSRNVDLFFKTISRREHWHESMSTLLEDGGQARFTMAGKTWRADPTSSGLAVTSVVPGWGFGWSNIFDDDLAEDIFSWLGHYCRQYIHRSNICKVLMAAWEKNGLILHPFGSGALIQRHAGSTSSGSTSKILAGAVQFVGQNWGAVLDQPAFYRSKWTERNTLDPSIQQGVSHFLRAQSLLKANFEIEALVAMDCVIQSVQNMDWSWASGSPKRNRRDLCKALGFGLPSQELSEEVYFIRNQFGAHAGGWRWWDTGEHLEGDTCQRASKLASRVLRKTADIEAQHRVFDPEPENWANWLEDNFDAIWTAVWFKDPP